MLAYSQHYVKNVTDSMAVQLISFFAHLALSQFLIRNHNNTID